MDWKQLKALNEQRGATLNEMKGLLKKAEDEKRDLSAAENTQFDTLNTKAESIKATLDRYEQAKRLDAELAAKGGEQRQQQPGRDDVYTPEQQQDEKAREYRSQFVQFLRGGNPVELRALTVAGQGVVGDRPFSTDLVKAMKTYAGVLEAGAEVIPTSDGNPLTIPTADDTANTGRLVGEATTNNNVTEPTLGTLALGAYKFDSDWIKVSIELLRDAAYPIESVIQQIAAERLGRAFNLYSTTGTGSGQPQGIVGAATTGKTAALNSAITSDEIIDLIHSVDAAYRNSGRARFMLSDTLVSALRKLKDSTGAYVWAAGLASAPSTLFGYGYVTNNDMPGFTAAATPVLFGDFSKYKIRTVAAPEVVRANELFIGDGLVGFKAINRMDGKLADAKAVKGLKLAA